MGEEKHHMRSVEERCSAVRGRARRLRRLRDGRAAAIVAALAFFSLADLVSRSASNGSEAPMPSGDELYGAASLFGPTAGGYVLVALAAAVVAVLITVFLMMRRKPSGTKEETPEQDTSADEARDDEQPDEDTHLQ